MRNPYNQRCLKFKMQTNVRKAYLKRNFSLVPMVSRASRLIMVDAVPPLLPSVEVVVIPAPAGDKAILSGVRNIEWDRFINLE